MSICFWVHEKCNSLFILFSSFASKIPHLLCSWEEHQSLRQKKKKCQTFIRFVPKLKKLKYLLGKKKVVGRTKQHKEI